MTTLPDGIPPLRWRQWRYMWLVQAAKWIVFAPVLTLWAAGVILKLAADWVADRLNVAYIGAYNADRRRACGRQPCRPGTLRPDGEL